MTETKIRVKQESDTITRIHLGKREIILVGTAHISQTSADEVESTIEKEKPDQVCIELDAARYKTMTEGASWKQTNIYQVIKQKKGFLLMANLVLSSYQKRIGADLGLSTGEEMKAAIRKAEEMKIPFTLADRDIQTTLRRAWKKSNFWNRNKLLAVIVSSVFSKEKITEEEIEQLKNKSAMEGMMDEMAKYLPSIKSVLIDERDRYLATKIFTAEGKKSVAVVGAGHAKGIVSWLEKLYKEEQEAELADLEQVPKKSIIGKIVPWIIPVIIVGMITVGFFIAGWEKALDGIFIWIMYNGILAVIGGILGLAHPLVILAAFPLAPVFSINPLMGTGILCGVLQSILRKPRVMDFESLNDDIQSFKGFYRNRVTHALVVMITISLGSLIGTFSGGIEAAKAIFQ